jgi:hypothetical protein
LAQGDFRPEHIWLGDPVRIIVCLDFNDRGMVDRFDEMAFLDNVSAVGTGRSLGPVQK